MKFVRIVAITLCWLLLGLLTIWAAAALFIDLHAAAGVAYLLALAVIFVLVKSPGRIATAGLVAFALVLTWWFTLRPSNDRPWQPDVARTAWADLAGDQVTIHNFRNCDYRTETDYTPDWETKSVRLSDLRGADIAIDYWGSPWMAHPMVSFQFDDNEHVVFSIETRKEMGESYSALRGFFRQYELIYLVGDERDFFRVRTNYRKGEDLYLYKLHLDPQKVRERFLEYVTRLNELHTQPAWYNALTTNCTTSIREQHAAAERTPFDWRIILNGKMDEMLYDQGAFDRSIPFAQLKQRAHINERARAADQAADFSRRIRLGDPSWSEGQ